MERLNSRHEYANDSAVKRRRPQRLLSPPAGCQCSLACSTGPSESRCCLARRRGGTGQSHRLLQGRKEIACFTPSQPWPHSPSIAFRHLPRISARTGDATEGALFISAQLSTDTVSALRKVINTPVEATQCPSTHVSMRRVRPGRKKIPSRFERFWD